MSSEDEIRKISSQFYAALTRMANGDAGSLADVWSHSKDVTAMHPIGGLQVGWDEVGKSFENVAKLASDGEIELKDQLVRVTGNLAYEMGIEHGRLRLAGKEIGIEHRVTNIYRLEAGSWKMVHHHTDTSQLMLDVIGSL